VAWAASNAVRYGPEQPIEVALTGDNHVARLSVRDEDIGIWECDQAQIFERFHALHGSGPMAVTHRLVRAMQGEIGLSDCASGLR
jgi:signal transduction histidine kinase